MASRNQSAVEYIKNARTHLLNWGFQNISVIVGKLYRRGVFTEVEVSKINSEKEDFNKTRTILDWVINKGEAACYELLKAIDKMTRKRTFLETPVSEEVATTSMQKSIFDLHHWISCFFFIDVVEIPHSKVWSIDLSKRKVSDLLEALKLQPEKKPVRLTGWNEESEVRILLQCLPYISQLSVADGRSETSETTKFLGKLICEAAEREEETGEKILELLSSVCNYKTFPFINWHDDDDDDDDDDDWKHRKYQCDVLLDLYSYVKNYETQTGRSVLPALQPVYQSVPAVWSIDFSDRKVSLLLEVLKLQPEKKPVELTGWSDGESEVRNFLQSLPHISQLSVAAGWSGTSSSTKFLGKLICEAAEREKETGEKFLELLSSVCNYKTFPFIDWDDDWKHRKYQCDVVLDIYSYVKNYETQTGRSVLSALQPVYQSVPAVWSVDLSERKVTLLLEVLKLQPEKKPVELAGWSDEEIDMRIFLQCLPYISQLSIADGRSGTSETTKLLGKLICEAAEREKETGEKILELLSAVCNYKTFPINNWSNNWQHRKYQCDVLLDLYSYVKNYETQTGNSVLPALKPVYQSAPAVWSIDLTERKVSLLLEVMKLQSEKKPVELRVWSDEESEMRIFLQCLPYISRLSIADGRSETSKTTKFLGKLISEAAELEEETGEKFLELLSSVCNYKTFPLIDWNDDWYDRKYQCDVLLDLYSYVKNYETRTGRSVLPALQLVYQSSPAVWYIDLSKRKVSLLLEVMKLQPEKKPVELRGWLHEESEVRIFLQCLPYISQLSVATGMSGSSETTAFLGKLICKAAEREKETGKKILELLYSVCNYKTFPFIDCDDEWYNRKYQCDVLLILYSYVKNYETRTGRSVLPALKPVYQSAPAVWSVDLSERNDSLLLEVMKLQPEKKPVELADWSYEESEVRIFLQCLPYISQLRCSKACLLQLLSLVSEGSERNTVMQAGSLAGALCGELDLSETRLDQKVCRCLALVLEHSEGLRELDLSHCQLTDQLLETLIPHLHKAQVLDLSHNNLTDALTDRLLQLLTINTSIQTVRLFNNCFKDTTPFLKDKRFEMLEKKKETDSDYDDEDDVASTKPYQKLHEGPTSQDSPREIVTPSVAIVSPLYPMLPSPSVSQQSSQHSTEELSRETACDFSTTDHPVTESLSSPHPSLELKEETDLSRCFSGLTMGESSSLPRSRSLPSMSQSPCIENKASFTAKRSHSLNDVTLLYKTQKITPDIIVVENKETYSFHCTQAGLFQCSLTGLVFKMETEGDVTYRTVPWNRRLLKPLGKRPAGPLFDTQCPRGSVCQLHLPHCEILSMGGGKSLSVVHVMDEGIELIKPDVITETHVIINITGFSPYGVVVNDDSSSNPSTSVFFEGAKKWVRSFFVASPIHALVLLFYAPLISTLKVLLLPGNVVLREVRTERRSIHPEEIYIEKPPCKLIPNQDYILTSSQDDSIIIQPKKTTFEVDESSYKNYVETFEVILKGKCRDHVRLLLKPLSHSHEKPVGDSNTSDCAWDCYVSLPAPDLRRQQVEHMIDSPEDRLFSVRGSLIQSISAPCLKCVVDKLFEKRMLTDSELEEASGGQAREEMARFVIDTVRRKGPDASSSMILILCDIDPFLSKYLGLMM